MNVYYRISAYSHGTLSTQISQMRLHLQKFNREYLVTDRYIRSLFI